MDHAMHNRSILWIYSAIVTYEQNLFIYSIMEDAQDRKLKVIEKDV